MKQVQSSRVSQSCIPWAFRGGSPQDQISAIIALLRTLKHDDTPIDEETAVRVGDLRVLFDKLKLDSFECEENIEGTSNNDEPLVRLSVYWAGGRQRLTAFTSTDLECQRSVLAKHLVRTLRNRFALPDGPSLTQKQLTIVQEPLGSPGGPASERSTNHSVRHGAVRKRSKLTARSASAM